MYELRTYQVQQPRSHGLSQPLGPAAPDPLGFQYGSSLVLELHVSEISHLLKDGTNVFVGNANGCNRMVRICIFW